MSMKLSTLNWLMKWRQPVLKVMYAPPIHKYNRLVSGWGLDREDEKLNSTCSREGCCPSTLMDWLAQRKLDIEYLIVVTCLFCTSSIGLWYEFITCTGKDFEPFQDKFCSTRPTLRGK